MGCYPCAGAQYGCEVSFQRVLSLPALYWKAALPVALFPSHCNICCLQYVNFVLHVRNAMNIGVCEMDVGALEAHQNDCSYVCQLSGLMFRIPTHKFSMVSGYADDLKNTQNCQNCMGMGACRGQYGSLMYKLSTWIALYVLRVLYILLNFC